ncbi:HAD hydrolase-like protein, partial [Patescibacteria group bacterium]|nr:HAD hydrolase-like protein [Patescibacteria group bacterium]
MNKTIKAIIFDMDGVLIDSESAWFRVEQMLFRKYNIKGNSSSIRDKLMGLSDNESIKILKNEFNIPASIKEIRDFRCKALVSIYKKELELRKGAQQLLNY